MGKRAEIQVIEYIKTLPEVVKAAKGSVYMSVAPINEQGKSDVFITVNRYESVPLDRTFSDAVTLLRVKVEIVVYGKAYEQVSSVVKAIQMAMEAKWEGACDGEIGLDPIQISNTVWNPFRLDYQIMESLPYGAYSGTDTSDKPGGAAADVLDATVLSIVNGQLNTTYGKNK